MAKPDPSSTPFTDLALRRSRRTTMSLFRNHTTGAIERPTPAPEPEPKPGEESPAAKPDPRDEEIRFYREQAARAAEVGRELDQHGRDLRWLTTFGTKAPRF